MQASLPDALAEEQYTREENDTLVKEDHSLLAPSRIDQEHYQGASVREQ